MIYYFQYSRRNLKNQEKQQECETEINNCAGIY